MTPTAQHCEHECVCCNFPSDITAKQRCPRVGCPHDTRSRPAPCSFSCMKRTILESAQVSHSATSKPEEMYLVTKKELDLIKNDCAYPERQFCDGCEYADGEDNTRASGLGCNFEGANAVMDRVLSRPAPVAPARYLPISLDFQPICIDKPCIGQIDICPVDDECDSVKQCIEHRDFLQENPDIAEHNRKIISQHDATIRVHGANEVTIDDFCICDLTRYIQEPTMDPDDVSRCRGKECNYCGKFTESLRQGEQE